MPARRRDPCHRQRERAAPAAKKIVVEARPRNALRDCVRVPAVRCEVARLRPRVAGRSARWTLKSGAAGFKHRRGRRPRLRPARAVGPASLPSAARRSPIAFA